MAKILSILPQKAIEYSFYLLFFLVPIILTPFNFELFEYNKMMLTYGLTTIIVGSWLIKMIINRRVSFTRTPLDLPLLLFLLSQIISTFLSIDRHVSIWGYYSRFNGGLLSTFSYILLYYAFVSNFPVEKIGKLLKVTLISGLLVSAYGILEHLGIDKNLWVQDVQNRVFSTLGQPNWLAAYLAVLIPISVGLELISLHGFELISDGKSQKSKVKSQNYSSKLKIGLLDNWYLLVYWFIGIIFYLTLIFTKSRSGFLGFWISLIVILPLCIFVALSRKYQSQKSSQIQATAYIGDNNIKLIGLYIISFIIVTFLFGSPFEQINRFTLTQLFKSPSPMTNSQLPIKPIGSSVIDIGITESGTIRKIVWKGAIDIFRHNPLFGTGVETFAFAYYKYRPVEHNMTSEWDFLYNKAHNEYLNYAATTGGFGLGSYLLIVLVFIGWNLSKLKVQSSNIKNITQNSKLLTLNSDFDFYTLNFALFAAWLSILITNFFGFSVVIIQLFFFLIPAIVFVLSDNRQLPDTNYQQSPITNYQFLIIFTILFFIFYFLYSLSRFWYADVIFADGYHKVRAQEIAPAYQSLKKALELNEEEPFYYDEFSYPAAQIAVAFADEKQATLSAVLAKEAIISSDFAVSRAVQNVNYWKTRTRVFYALSAIDEKYLKDSITALEQAKILSPTDPKVRYNLALMYDRVGRKKEAFEELIKTTELKPDYRDAFFALGYLYEKDKKIDKAKESLQYILTKIATDDAEAKKKLEELK